MPGHNERNCQIRMSSSLWDQVGEIARELGFQDARGGHSALAREMIAAGVAKWTHSPYVCRSSRHMVLVTARGDIFYRQVQILHLNSQRERLPSSIEMKQEKRDYYHQKYRKLRTAKGKKERIPEELEWFQSQWLLNFLAVWNGRLEANDIDSFGQEPLSARTDLFGPTYKSADLEVHSMAGRFLTREITVALRDYVQWKEPKTPPFDRIDIPIDIPTANLEVCVVVDKGLFSALGVEPEAIANLALEFRNRESARFESQDVARYRELDFYGQAGRSDDEGAQEVGQQVSVLEARIKRILQTGEKRVSLSSGVSSVVSTLIPPDQFLYYKLRWPAPHLGIEVCVRWEKPVRKEEAKRGGIPPRSISVPA